MRRARSAVFGLIFILLSPAFPGTAAQPPANDSFVNARVLDVSPLDGTNDGATSETGEPSVLSSGAFASVWHQYQQASEGTLWLQIGSTTTQFKVAVYRGDTLLNLQQLLVASVNPGDYGRLILHVEPGVPYRIAVDSPRPITGTYSLISAFNPGTPPTNDWFAGRTLLTGLTNSVMGNTSNGSSEALDPASYGNRRSLWYEYQVPESGRLVRQNIQAANIYSIVWRGPPPFDSYSSVSSGGTVQAGESLYLMVTSTVIAGYPFEIVLGVDPSPVLSVTSTNLTFTEGALAVLSASYVGSEAVHYQWFKEQLPVENGTNLVLQLGQLRAEQVGTYHLTATSAYGSATSSPVQVFMKSSLLADVRDLPASITVHEGALALLGPATLSGDPPLVARWDRETPWGWVSLGQTNAELRLQPAHWEDAGRYRLSASNALGSASAIVELKVDVSLEPPVILAQPQNLNIPAGAPVEVPILVSGRAPCVFYWRTNGVPVPAQMMPALNPGALPTGTHLVVDGVVSNAAGTAAIAPFQLTLVGQSIYRQDFESELDPSKWPTETIRRSARHGQAEGSLLMPKLSLSLKAAAGALVVGWDGWMVGSWDGEDGQWGVDRITARLGSSDVMSTSFSNNDGEYPAGIIDLANLFMQSFPGKAGEGAFDPRSGSLGVDPTDHRWYGTPTLYRFRHSVNWDNSPIPLVLETSGLSDESLSLDNLYVSLLPTSLAWIRPAKPAIALSESAGPAQVRLLREGNTNTAVTVRFALVGYGAVTGRDFAGEPSSITFAPGVTEAVISIPIFPNPAATRTKCLGVWLLDAGAEGVFSATPFVGISLRDDQSTIRLVQKTASLKEGASGVVAQATRSGDVTGRQSVTLAVVSQSVWGTLHVTGWVGGTNQLTNLVYLYFPSGETNAIAPLANYYPPFKAPVTNALGSLNIAARSDAQPELPSPFTIQLIQPLSAGNPSDDEVSFTILDDDLTSTLRTLTWKVDVAGNSLSFAMTAKPVRFRIEVQSSEDLIHWTSRLELNSLGQGSLPLDGSSPRQFYRAAFLPN